MNETTKKIQDKKQNIKLFPLYKALSWDLLFYYSISFLFLTQIKGISAAQVLFSDAFYPVFKFLFQIPTTAIINKIGKRKGLILGNLFVGASVLAVIFATNLSFIIFSQFLSALGYALKGISEENFLFDSIPNSKKRNDLFSKINGKSNAWYYYLDAVSSMATGFLFVFNGYLPMIISFTFCLLSSLLALKFVEVDDIAPKLSKDAKLEQKKQHMIRENLLDIKEGFSFIFKSNRLKCLILFCASFNSILAILVSLRSSILADLQLPEQYYGIIFAVLGIISGITSQNSQWFHRRFRNTTLKVFGLSVSISMIFVGLCVIGGLNWGLCIEIILLCFLLQYIIKGPYYNLIKRYLNSFSTPTMRVKIYSASDLCYSIFRAGISFIASFLLGFASTSYVFVILGCSFTLFYIFLLDYMKDKVGLKPEQYSKQEIELVESK